MNYVIKSKMDWSFDDIESRVPWEREIYVALHLEEIERQKMEAEAN